MIAPVEQREGTKERKKERKKEVEMIDLCLTPKAPYKRTERNGGGQMSITKSDFADAAAVAETQAEGEIP